jgi:periplasmic divalent cation tolerance protein
MYIAIFVTAPSKKEAETIARRLLKKRLVACVNILEGIESFFWWQKKIDTAKEALLIVKSTKTKFNKIAKLVKSLHSYEVPEIIALPVIAGNKDYLGWIDECTCKLG